MHMSWWGYIVAIKKYYFPLFSKAITDERASWDIFPLCSKPRDQKKILRFRIFRSNFARREIRTGEESLSRIIQKVDRLTDQHMFFYSVPHFFYQNIFFRLSGIANSEQAERKILAIRYQSFNNNNRGWVRKNNRTFFGSCFSCDRFNENRKKVSIIKRRSFKY